MAQTGYTPILIYSSSTASNAPAAGNLTNSTLGSELAINITDGKLFYKDNANAIQVIGWKVTPATAGGTGQTSYAVGDILYANTTTSLAKVADVATGNALISGGVGVAPAWGKIGLTTHVSGTLPIANGGTAQTSFTANYIHYGSFSTSANLQFDGTNFGVGGAPSAFAGGYYGLQTKTFAMWSAGGAGGQLSTNLYFNGSSRIYIGNGVASEYQQSGGGHYWSTAASGTAGNAVSLTQLMQLAPSGGLSLGNATDPGAANFSLNGNVIYPVAGKGSIFGTSGIPTRFAYTLDGATVSTTAVTCSQTASSGGGVVYISGYNASGGNRFVALIGYRDTAVTSIYTSNNTGLTINFTATSNVLQIATTSGSIICSSVSFTL